MYGQVRTPKDPARIHPARRVSRWRATAVSAVSSDAPHRTFDALMADRLTSGETELFPSEHETL